MKAITTKFHGPTNSRGSRYSASDEGGNRVTLSADYELNSDGNHDAAARALCVKMDWTAHDLVRGATKNGYVYVFDAAWEHVQFTDAEKEAGKLAREKRAQSKG